MRKRVHDVNEKERNKENAGLLLFSLFLLRDERTEEAFYSDKFYIILSEDSTE